VTNYNFFNHIVYKSKEMHECIEKAEVLARSGNDIIIYGEYGTEKDQITRAIHKGRTKNNNSSFISVNCSSISDASFQIELFGSSEKPGVIQLTKDGTLYLDDVSGLSLYSQTVLLDLLKNRSFRRIGECIDTPIKCQFIFSSGKDLLELVKARKFNLELYYLISILPIYIPPLRRRPEDIKVLSEYFIDKYNESYFYSGRKFLHPDALKVLNSYQWPGNTIELKNVITRALYSSQNNAIKPKDITFNDIDIENNILAGSLKEQIQVLEKKIVEKTLKRYKSARKTADILEVSHTTILKKIRKYGLEKYIS
jgi:TyrR family helix-turn-helix protein